MEKLISFIIPAYNAETYLEKCLNSFLIEEEWFQKIEIIIVDDGSFDKTVEIAKEYQQNYSGMIRYISKVNGGHGSAINAAYKIVRGKYMKVMDADDFINTEKLIPFLKKLTKAEADLIITGFYTIDFYTAQRELWQIEMDEMERDCTWIELMKCWNKIKYCCCFHGMTYLTRFYQKFQNELPEKVYYEDYEYAAIPACYSKRIRVINLPLYIYQIGNERQSVSIKNKYQKRNDMKIVILDMQKKAEKIAENTIEKRYLDYKLNELILSYIITLLLMGDYSIQDRKEVKDLWIGMEAKRKKKLRKRYYVIFMLSRLHISYESYQKVIDRKRKISRKIERIVGKSI